MCLSIDSYNKAIDAYFYIPGQKKWKNSDVVRIASWVLGGAVLGGIAWLLGRGVAGVRNLYGRVSKIHVGNRGNATKVANKILSPQDKEMQLQVKGLQLREEIANNTDLQACIFYELQQSFGVSNSNIFNEPQLVIPDYIKLLSNLDSRKILNKKNIKDSFDQVKNLYNNRVFKQRARSAHKKISEYIEFCFIGEITRSIPSESERLQEECRPTSKKLVERAMGIVANKNLLQETRLAAKILLENLINPYTQQQYQELAKTKKWEGFKETLQELSKLEKS